MLNLIKFLLAVFLLSACSLTSQFFRKSEFLKQEIPQNLEIKLARTACYGTCPVYELTIYADGKVIFEGKQNVRVQEKAEGQISQEQVKQIIDEFEKADYFSLNDQYKNAQDGCPTFWTDSPSVNTSIRFGEHEKAISHYYGCREKGGGGAKVYPAELYQLESKIDEIANTKQWINP